MPPYITITPPLHNGFRLHNGWRGALINARRENAQCPGRNDDDKLHISVKREQVSHVLKAVPALLFSDHYPPSTIGKLPTWRE
ncbi:hypothetical protein ACYZTX_00285 [Pseudomonas sp. MDT1-17]